MGTSHHGTEQPSSLAQIVPLYGGSPSPASTFWALCEREDWIPPKGLWHPDVFLLEKLKLNLPKREYPDIHRHLVESGVVMGLLDLELPSWIYSIQLEDRPLTQLEDRRS
jgi:hypothetical protein